MIASRALISRGSSRMVVSSLLKQRPLSLSVLSSNTSSFETSIPDNNNNTHRHLDVVSHPLIRQRLPFSTVIQGTVSDGVPSSHETQRSTPGKVTKTMRVLDMSVVKRIMEELRSVDVNSDGRIETDELKQLLRKHNSAFTETEIMEIGEMFYAGKSGGSVSFDRFVEALDKVVQQEYEPDADSAGNPLDLGTCGNEFLFFHSHGDYTKDELTSVEMVHTEPQNMRDRMALSAVKGVRFLFDMATGWSYGDITPDKIMNRTIYLETIAAVPGMVAAITRHFKSLRTMQRDGGMMQMFLDEANNERMHLLSFIRLKNPGYMFRAAVIAGQFGFGAAFGLSYLISPKFCHRFVGYIEEEAVTTYTKVIDVIEKAPKGSELSEWRTMPAPKIARSYWKLGTQGTILDMMYAVRLDEAEHRDVNHLCSELNDGAPNPVANTEKKLNTMLLKYVQDMMEKDPEKPLKMMNQA